MNKVIMYVVILALCLMVVGCSIMPTSSIRNINENQEAYVGKVVSVKGMAYNFDEEFQRLKDFDGYSINFKNSAGNNLYFYNYVVTGVFTKTQKITSVNKLDTTIGRGSIGYTNETIYYINATTIKRIS